MRGKISQAKTEGYYNETIVRVAHDMLHIISVSFCLFRPGTKSDAEFKLYGDDRK